MPLILRELTCLLPFFHDLRFQTTSNSLMHPELRSLIKDFRVTQDRAIDFLHSVLKIPLPSSGRDWVKCGHRAVLEAVKNLECPTIQLDPHGYGIEIIHPDFRIDFDYGPNGEIDCFDLWRLAIHRHNLNNSVSPIGPYEDLSAWFQDAVDRSELQKVPGSNDRFVQDPALLRSPKDV